MHYKISSDSSCLSRLAADARSGEIQTTFHRELGENRDLGPLDRALHF